MFCQGLTLILHKPFASGAYLEGKFAREKYFLPFPRTVLNNNKKKQIHKKIQRLEISDTIARNNTARQSILTALWLLEIY